MSIEPADVVVAVDLGGTALKGSLVSETGETVASATHPTPQQGIVDALLQLIEDLRREASARDRRVIAAAVVTPGMVDERTGEVAYASNLGWRDMPLLARLQERLPFPVAVGHDVRAAGLAERRLGVARGVDDFTLIPIGTGMAAALVSAEGPIRGALGAAGEIGHIPIVQDGEQCTCGQRGCLEVYVSGAGVARRYAARAGGSLSSREIVARLGSDPHADAVWDEATRALAQGLATVTLLLDPEVIVLGGGFSQAGSVLLDPVVQRLDEALAWRAAPRVMLSSLGGDAGRIGAAVLAFERVGRHDVPDTWVQQAAPVSLA
ncbi:ROK family protein [Salinibacterium sp. SYSU T00001]|uniref:ROK family protein n=1 Tax=Homoserinimonas sedimenticola TaxID=2986805 RepID=UPI00223549F4|nr:ROK family protein [Salinibacterium sedimenticola]MCW4385253.1 ROK family protein [Salinibacterium sedimenticola]